MQTYPKVYILNKLHHNHGLTNHCEQIHCGKCNQGRWKTWRHKCNKRARIDQHGIAECVFQSNLIEIPCHKRHMVWQRELICGVKGHGFFHWIHNCDICVRYKSGRAFAVAEQRPYCKGCIEHLIGLGTHLWPQFHWLHVQVWFSWLNHFLSNQPLLLLFLVSTSPCETIACATPDFWRNQKLFGNHYILVFCCEKS